MQFEPPQFGASMVSSVAPAAAVVVGPAAEGAVAAAVAVLATVVATAVVVLATVAATAVAGLVAVDALVAVAATVAGACVGAATGAALVAAGAWFWEALGAPQLASRPRPANSKTGINKYFRFSISFRHLLSPINLCGATIITSSRR